jgi:hypothetical protein
VSKKLQIDAYSEKRKNLKVHKILISLFYEIFKHKSSPKKNSILLINREFFKKLKNHISWTFCYIKVGYKKETAN